MLNLQSLPVSQLVPAPYNPRIALQPGTPAWNRLERSLEEFSLIQPIVWNERTGHVIAGHQRLEILKHQGHAAVDCVVVDLPLEREKALNVTLNNSHVGSDWDPERLVELLQELAELPDFDPTLTGFDESHLQDLLLAPVDAPPAREEDRSPNSVQVHFEIPAAQWDNVRSDLDDFLAQHQLLPHIRLPSRREGVMEGRREGVRKPKRD